MKYLSPEQDQQIRQLVRDCGQLAERMSTTKFQVFQKGPGDFVTSVDQALDQYLLSAFAKLFPQDGIITEENSASRHAFYANHSRLWLIDPLDGTDGFIHGGFNYAVMVGLLQSYQPVAGWIYAPVIDQMYFGGLDWGVFQMTKGCTPESLERVQPAAPSADFCPILLGPRDQENYGAAIAHLIPEAQFHTFGSFGLKVIHVIQGKAGLYLYLNGRVKLWDTAAAIALANAAGLVCCDLEGKPLLFTPNALHPETLAHEQAILIGWPEYVTSLRPKIYEAVYSNPSGFSATWGGKRPS